MCSCMHRWLPAKALITVGRSAVGDSLRNRLVLNGRDGLLLVYRGASSVNRSPQQRGLEGRGWCAGSSAVAAMEDQVKEGNGKRMRDFLSPLRPDSSSRIKKTKANNKNSPLPDYIQLSTSPPHVPEELDFFVIDTCPSAIKFHNPDEGKDDVGVPGIRRLDISPPKSDKKSAGEGGKLKSSKDKSISEKSSVQNTERSRVCSEKENERFEVIEIDDDSFSDKSPCKNISYANKLKTNIVSRKRQQSDDCDIVFESAKDSDSDVALVCVVQGKKKDLLSPGTSGIRNERRGCHTSTKHGFKLREDTPAEEHESKDWKGKNKSANKSRKYQKASGSHDSDIESVDVIDLDVVKVDDAQPSSSRSVDVIEMVESDNESRSSSESDYETKHVDISSSEYISLDKMRVADIQHSDVQIDDATFDRRKELEKLRVWDLTGLGNEVLRHGRVASSDTVFTVMSYNVLAQSLLTDNMSLYRLCNEEHLSWRYRWALLQHEISDLDPDVVMLQEVQASHLHTHYLPWFTLQGYEGVFKKRTGTKADGCAIFYKKSKFTIVEHCSVEYNQPMARNILDRDNIGLIVKLAPVKNPQGSPLCVATTHLLYNPRRHDVKLAQAVLLLTEIDRLCYQGEVGGRTKYCPIIITGDFNAEPHSAVLDFMKSGRLNYEGLSTKYLARHGSLGSCLGPELLPARLGITDQCQHAVLAQGRFLENKRGQMFSLPDKRSFEDNLIHLHHSERKPCTETTSRGYASSRSVSGSGYLSHGFCLNSVYQHRLKRMSGAPEVTTHHDNGWTTVDYMFYSRVFSQSLQRVVEGRLKLLGRYGLLSGQEAHRFGPMPSGVCPSDHFPLAAQFMLKQ